jgi:hypothetical protein
MPTDPPPPRRNKHLARWFLVLAIATFGWSGWQAYAFRAALAQAKALEWEVYYTDPIEEIRDDWKTAFKKSTWLDGVVFVLIPTSESFEQNLTIIYRLNTERLQIDQAHTLRDLSSLRSFTQLKAVVLTDCTALTNVDALKNLSALETVVLDHCTALTNVDALKNLPALEVVKLIGGTALPPESIPALKAALPNAKITGP